MNRVNVDPLNLKPVDSSSMHSADHDETGQYVRFHLRDCARTIKPLKGDPQPACNCAGGPSYHYPGVPFELHQRMMAAPSIGAFFAKHVKAAKHPETGALLYPHAKQETAKP